MMKNYICLIAVCLFFQVNVNAQMIPCENGRAGDYSCQDYDLMSNINTRTLSGSGSARGSDIWGWTDPTSGREFAIVGMSNSTAFVEITDPVNPIFLGRLDSHQGATSPWRDIKIYNDFAFIVADSAGSHGMQVFDLKRLTEVTSPQTFNTDARYTGVGSCHNIVINESEAVAYLVGCGGSNGASGGPVFIDISNPLRPTKIGSYSRAGYSHDAQVITYNGPDRDYQGKEIYIGSNGNSDKIAILDVTNKRNVSEISRFTYPQTSYAHQGWFTEDQRYFILGDETDEQGFGFNTKTIVFDLKDLDNPKISYTYFGTTKAIDHNGYVKGDKFYIANYRAGMRVLDLTNIASTTNAMTEVGYFDTYPGSNSAQFSGAWSIYPYFPSGNIVISDINRGLFVVRQSNTLSNDEFDLDQSFSLSPNPTTSIASIKASEGRRVESVEIFNILGQNIFKKEDINQSAFALPMANYSKGVYLIKINDTVTKKLVVK